MTTLDNQLWDTDPPAPPGFVNVKWQANAPGTNPRHISGYVPAAGSPAGGSANVVVLSLAPTNPGNFTVAHGAGTTPTFVIITMTSGGAIWLQTPTSFDATNLYLVASAGGVTATAYVWTSPADAVVPFTSSAGNFSVAHGLGVTPGLVLVEMTSGGAVWFQTPNADATNVYLTGSAAGLTGKVIVFKTVPTITVVRFQQIALAPGAPGNFTVAHSLGVVPKMLAIRMTSGGAIWEQNPTGFDASNLYLVASAGGITGFADVWG